MSEAAPRQHETLRVCRPGGKINPLFGRACIGQKIQGGWDCAHMGALITRIFETKSAILFQSGDLCRRAAEKRLCVQNFKITVKPLIYIFSHKQNHIVRFAVPIKSVKGVVIAFAVGKFDVDCGVAVAYQLQI